MIKGHRVIFGLMILLIGLHFITSIRVNLLGGRDLYSSFLEQQATLEEMVKELSSSTVLGKTRLGDPIIDKNNKSGGSAPTVVRHGRDTITLSIGYGPISGMGELPFFGNTGPKVPIIITSPQPILDIESLSASYQKEASTPGSAAYVDEQALAQAVTNPKVNSDQVAVSLKSTLQSAAYFAADAELYKE
ncbi:signal peptide containing protein [Cryptosporidium canis]|uniref:Signal peptide containing protein n=1 Tax=Cryptosporidium canis TaxID=195482 RepID=A0ABQ8PBQ4_9CRYT|nr:signal peptide containing protein [Cryptosporidium canis]KAJ1615308.1 signal peptide containing protein [Cryptosporidium canis]